MNKLEIIIAVAVDTGNRYFVLNDKAEMKHPETREWVRAFIYTDNVNIYCREERDFRKRFEIIR